MSIALERSNSGTDQSIERPGFVSRNMTCASAIYNSPDFSLAADRRVSPVEEEEDRSASLSTSSASSIGKNSDDSSGGGGEGEEVQSEYKQGALDSLDALEEVLPGKRGISKFYCGKSKSFTSLTDAATCSSMKDIVKPENEYSRKRKNLMAYKNFWDRNTNNVRNNRGGISKRPNNSRSILSLAAISNCESSNCETSNSTSSSPGCSLPPLPPNARRTIFSELSSSPPADKFSSWRSFSLSDLQGAAADASSPGIPGLWINNRGK